MSIQKSLAIGSDEYDYTLSKTGDIKLAEGSEQIALFIKERLKFYAGEWVFDIRAGVPWFQKIFKRPYRKSLIDSLIKATILKTNGVTGLVEYSSQLEPKTRVFSVFFRYTDIYNTTQEITFTT